MACWQRTVRITCSEAVGGEVLPSILRDMRDAHPALSVELSLSNRAGNLLQREADIAVRMFRPTQEALVARHLGTVELGLFARPDYLERHGAPASARELQKHTLIGYDRENDYTRKMRRTYPALEGLHFDVKSDSDLAQLEMETKPEDVLAEIQRLRQLEHSAGNGKRG